MKKRLYVAYGSNLNMRQMKYRCPTAELYATGTIEDHELQFKGHPSSAFATIAPKEGATVPVAVWEIQPEDEQALDRYEGYPSHYFKQDISMEIDGEEVTAMVYIMNPKMQFGLPSPSYYQTVYEGYKDCELDTDVLEQAVRESAQRFYSSAVARTAFHCLADYEETCEDREEDNEKLNDDHSEEEPDEDDSFRFSDGMQM